MALNQAIDKAIQMSVASCAPSYMVQQVNIEGPASLALDDASVVNYILARSQNLAWQSCPRSSFDVAVEIRIQGQRALWARAYNSAGPSAPTKATWQEYINTFRDEKLSRYNAAYTKEFNRREATRKEDEARRIQQQTALQQQKQAEQKQSVIAQLASHGTTATGPRSAEVLQCVNSFFPRMGFSAPMFKPAACSDYMGIESVTTSDTRDIPGGIEVMTDIIVVVTEPFASDSMLAGACGVVANVTQQSGARVRIPTRIAFEKWNSGLRCTSQHW